MLIMIPLCGNVTANHINLYNQYGWIIISDFYQVKGCHWLLSQRPTTAQYEENKTVQSILTNVTTALHSFLP